MKKLILTLGIMGAISTTLFGADARTLMKDNGCMECHNIRGIKKAPAFTGIARRNLRRNSYEIAKGIIIDSIKGGSKGKYGNFTDEMPAFDYFSNQDLETMADYILSLGNNKRGRGRGRGRGMGGGGGRGMM